MRFYQVILLGLDIALGSGIAVDRIVQCLRGNKGAVTIPIVIWAEEILLFVTIVSFIAMN